MRSRLAVLAIVGLAIVGLAIVGHVVYWYLPREQAARPDPEGGPGRLLGDSRWDYRVWVPRPHQNLAVLRAGVQDVEGYLEAVGRLTGEGPPGLPGFGPFSVPPAAELTVAYDEEGGFVVVARMYPLMALVGKLSGRLAGNPWLAGGPVAVDGRKAEVSWEGREWRLRTGVSEPPAASPSRLPRGLAMLAISAEHPPLPAGVYVVEREPGGLRIWRWSAEEGTGRPASPPALSADGVFLMALQRADGEQGARAALLMEVVDDRLGELPSAAVLFERADFRYRLPAEDFSSLLGLRLHEAETESWRILALDRRALRAAERWAPGLADLSRSEEGPDFALWLQPGAMLRFAGHLRATLGALPLISRREVLFWRDVETVLTPLGDIAECRLSVTGREVDLVLRLGPR